MAVSAGVRSFAARNYWRAMSGAERIDPTPVVAQVRFRGERRGALLSVYRHDNASNVLSLLSDTPPTFARSLWALDRPHPVLEEWTVGTGIVMADDDVIFTAGNLAAFLCTADAGYLGLAQPAHDRSSAVSHWITAARRLFLVRLTTFVEIGPLVAVAPAWRDSVLPLEDDGMGWGLDLRWSDLRASGCRLWIVDACRVRHLAPVVGSASYDVDELRVDMEPLYDARGGYENALRTSATWRPWARQPPRARA